MLTLSTLHRPIPCEEAKARLAGIPTLLVGLSNGQDIVSVSCTECEQTADDCEQPRRPVPIVAKNASTDHKDKITESEQKLADDCKHMLR